MRAEILNAEDFDDMVSGGRFDHLLAETVKTRARVVELEAMLRPLADFWESVRETIFDGVDGPDAQEWAESAGLLVQVIYDPEVHGEIEEAEPGDSVYVDSPVGVAAARYAAKVRT